MTGLDRCVQNVNGKGGWYEAHREQAFIQEQDKNGRWSQQAVLKPPCRREL